jgi:hypothetical protein
LPDHIFVTTGQLIVPSRHWQDYGLTIAWPDGDAAAHPLF